VYYMTEGEIFCVHEKGEMISISVPNGEFGDVQFSVQWVQIMTSSTKEKRTSRGACGLPIRIFLSQRFREKLWKSLETTANY
jgi:hypothetical protein